MPRRVSDYDPQFAELEPVHLDRLVRARRLDHRLPLQHDQSWRRGPIAPANPWRALTLEWQVSSPPPIFNFDEIPQVVGGPYEYGVPGARHAVLNGDRAAVETEEVRNALMHLLVVANETVTGRKLIDAVEATRGRRGRPGHRHRARQPAEARLRRLRGHAAGRGGAAARPDALDAPAGGDVRARARGRDRSGHRRARCARPARAAVDEIIVATHPQEKSGWLRKNVVERIRERRRGPTGRARRRRRHRGGGTGEHPRRRERDGHRRAPPRRDPRARGAGRRRASSSSRRRATRRRARTRRPNAG